MDNTQAALAELRGLPARVLIETLAALLGMTAGHWTLELRLVDGKLAKAWKHEGPIAARDLDEIAL